MKQLINLYRTNISKEMLLTNFKQYFLVFLCFANDNSGLWSEERYTNVTN